MRGLCRKQTDAWLGCEERTGGSVTVSFPSTEHFTRANNDLEDSIGNLVFNAARDYQCVELSSFHALVGRYQFAIFAAAFPTVFEQTLNSQFPGLVVDGASLQINFDQRAGAVNYEIYVLNLEAEALCRNVTSGKRNPRQVNSPPDPDRRRVTDIQIKLQLNLHSLTLLGFHS